MSLTPRDLIEKWELEHRNMCVGITTLQSNEPGGLSKMVLTAEADILKACINELKVSINSAQGK